MKKLSLNQLEADMILAQDVYVSDDTASSYLKKGAVLSEKVIENLGRHGVASVMIQTEEDAPLPAPGTPISQLVHTSVAPPAPAVDTELRKEALDSLENVFDTVATGNELHATSQVIQQMDAVVNQLVESLQTSQEALVNIGDLKSYDDYTYHHSLSVAVLSIGIGQYIGLKGQDLQRLGLCAIMHDIGKTTIPVEIIRKPARLTNDEFSLIKTHSANGSDYLVESAIGDADLWAGVKYHHEKVDGTGYPDGLKGNDIPAWSRIISVADVYDALTSNRPYRQPMQPLEALEYIMGGTGTSFDYDIVTSFLRKVDLYPVGSFVQLSDGRYAVVLDNENQQRPIVEIIGTGDIIDMYRDRNALSLVIARTVPEDQLLTGIG